MKRLIFSLVMMAAATGAARAEGLYAGAKYMMIDVELDVLGFISFDAEPTGLALVVGNELSPNLAVEGTFLLSGSDAEYGGVPGYKIEMSSLFDVSIVGKNKLSPAMEIFGKAGLAILEFEDSDGDTASETGLSFGFGANLAVSPSANIFAEYLFFPDATQERYSAQTITSQSLNIGATVKF